MKSIELYTLAKKNILNAVKIEVYKEYQKNYFIIVNHHKIN
jgi:hypothetical protein